MPPASSSPAGPPTPRGTFRRRQRLRIPLALLAVLAAAASPAAARNSLERPPGGGDALPASTADHNVNQVQTTITDVGAYGYYDPVNNQNLGLGFRFNGLPSALFHGGLIYATSPSTVSDAAYGSDDNGATRPFNFRSTATITTGGNPQITQYTCCTYNDSDFDTAPLGVSTRQSTYAWLGDSYVIIDLRITATTPTNGLFVALYTDWDIGTATQNQVSYDPSRQLGIMSSLAGDPNFYGMQLLSHPASGYRAVDNAVFVYPSGPDPGFEDADKFQFCQGFTVIQSDRPADWSNLIAAGPFDLQIGQSVRVGFAMLAASTPSGLMVAADQARSRWNSGIEVPCVGQGACRYPPAGTDSFESTGQVTVDIPSLGAQMTVPLSGPVSVDRSNPIDQGGLLRIDTHMRQLDLSGVSCLGPLHARLNPQFPSTGTVLQLQPGICYPAASSFDLFVTVEAAGLFLHNSQPIHLTSTVQSLPPYEDSYVSAAPVVLYDGQGTQMGTLEQEIHTPQPPVDCMGSTAEVQFQFFSNPPETYLLSGPVAVQRDAPLFNPNTGLWEVQTEMLSLDLRGQDPAIGPVRATLNSEHRTLGMILQPQFETYPALSFFDVFYKVQFGALPDVAVVNPVASRLSATIPGVPPIGSEYLNETTVPVVDWKTGDPVGSTTRHRHTPTTTSPWRPYPLAGSDNFCGETDLHLHIGQNPVSVTGGRLEWAIDRADPMVQGDGLATISTITTQFDASGFSPELGGMVYVWLSGIGTVFMGEIRQLALGPTFPAASDLDLYLKIWIPSRGLVLKNYDPFRISARNGINSIPFSEPHSGSTPVALLRQDDTVVGTLDSLVATPQLPFDGSCNVSPVCGVQSVGVPGSPAPGAPLRLYPTIPNPFSSSATIQFDLPARGKVSVLVYNLAGRLLRVLEGGELETGRHAITWDGRDDRGGLVASGLYLYTVKTPAGSVSGRLLLVR